MTKIAIRYAVIVTWDNKPTIVADCIVERYELKPVRRNLSNREAKRFVKELKNSLLTNN